MSENFNSNAPENQPVLLTAGFPAQFVHFSYDKLTVVGKWNPSCVRKTDGQIHLPKLDRCPDTQSTRNAAWPYRHNIHTLSGCAIQLADKTSHVPPVRLHWNPNNPDQHSTALLVLSMMHQKRVTRIDYAVDYGQDLSEFIRITSSPRSSVTYLGKSYGLETHYLGAPGSANQIRIYDKAHEQKIEGTLWRIEQESTFKPNQDWRFTLPFCDFFAGKLTPQLPIIDQLVLDGLRRDNDAWGKFSRREKEKYRKILKVSQHIERLKPHPLEVFYAQAQPFIDSLTDYLKDDFKHEKPA